MRPPSISRFRQATNRSGLSTISRSATSTPRAISRPLRLPLGAVKRRKNDDEPAAPAEVRRPITSVLSILLLFKDCPIDDDTRSCRHQRYVRQPPSVRVSESVARAVLADSPRSRYSTSMRSNRKRRSIVTSRGFPRRVRPREVADQADSQVDSDAAGLARLSCSRASPIGGIWEQSAPGSCISLRNSAGFPRSELASCRPAARGILRKVSSSAATSCRRRRRGRLSGRWGAGIRVVPMASFRPDFVRPSVVRAPVSGLCLFLLDPARSGARPSDRRAVHDRLGR